MDDETVPKYRCPQCKHQEFEDLGAVYSCHHCFFTGWPWDKPVVNGHRTGGYPCPRCENDQLDYITTIPAKVVDSIWGADIRRCPTCNYTAVEPAD